MAENKKELSPEKITIETEKLKNAAGGVGVPILCPKCREEGYDFVEGHCNACGYNDGDPL